MDDLMNQDLDPLQQFCLPTAKLYPYLPADRGGYVGVP